MTGGAEGLRMALAEVAPEVAASVRSGAGGRPMTDRRLDSPETRRRLFRAHELVCADVGQKVMACFECYSDALDAPDSVGSLALLDKWGCGHV